MVIVVPGGNFNYVKVTFPGLQSNHFLMHKKSVVAVTTTPFLCDNIYPSDKVVSNQNFKQQIKEAKVRKRLE